jgi:lipoprotein-anchoring transpeptidase ErfK/SrfK
MRRVRLGLAAVCLVVAGGAAASVLTGSSLGSRSTDSTSTSVSTGTLTIRPAPPPKPKPVRRIARGVTIGGVYVGGLEPDVAEEVVRTAFDSRLVLLVRDRRVSASPDKLGARAYVEAAVAHARSASAGAAVHLMVVVRRAAVRAYANRLATTFARNEVDAQVSLEHLRPKIAPGHPGLAIDRRETLSVIVKALQRNRRGPLVVPSRLLPQQRTEDDFGSVIVIRRSSNQLFLYRGAKYWRRFGVATGQSAYPTPLGRFQIVVKWRNPWWYPPPSPWAQGLRPVPPGPGNPLGTRWMGLSSPGVGIHGTPDSASIGYSASHGCIRMYIPNAEWLFDHVEIETPVFIVAA